jgi:hypothetical protein
VLSITGEGGVGKSTLLKQFVRMAKVNEIDANLVQCDDHQMTPVEVMGFVAEEFAKLKLKNREFDERYSKYRQLREQAEKDPNVPRGLLDVGARVVTDVALDSISRVPGLGSTGSDSFKKVAGDAVAEAGQYMFSRWSNKDEVLLLREPEKTLTPLFIQLLNEPVDEKRLVIMLDVFERTARQLTPWLLDVFTFHYGKISTRIAFVISGRDQLSQHWTDLGKRLIRLALEPFELKESREYLINRNITDETLIAQIHKDTGGLPVLVELLAATNPQPGKPLPDISQDAVERFLQWTLNEMRQVALLAAVPRQFNKDVLAAVLGDNADAKFDWLVDQSYIRSDSEHGWFYHEKVRTLMLRYQRNLSPHELDKNHTKLTEHFTSLQSDLHLSVQEIYKNKTWRHYEAERVYHLFSASPEKHWPKVIHAFLQAFQYQWHFAVRLIKLAKLVVDESNCSSLAQDILDLETLLNDFEKDNYEPP